MERLVSILLQEGLEKASLHDCLIPEDTLLWEEGEPRKGLLEVLSREEILWEMFPSRKMNEVFLFVEDGLFVLDFYSVEQATRAQKALKGLFLEVI